MAYFIIMILKSCNRTTENTEQDIDLKEINPKTIFFSVHPFDEYKIL